MSQLIINMLQPTYNQLFIMYGKHNKKDLLEELEQMEGGLVLGSDGRADSPGH